MAKNNSAASNKRYGLRRETVPRSNLTARLDAWNSTGQRASKPNSGLEYHKPGSQKK